MRTLVLTLGVAGLLLSADTAAAQTLEYKPIDTTKMVVQPGDAAANIFSRTAKILNRVVADTIDSNGFVKTLNNLLGRTDTKATTQPGGLPLPTLYKQHPNSFTPAMPTYQQFGTTPGGRR